ncbi:hypothetical protein BGZ82_011005 [Podila clonocystis]|nr:hypothetical protein BGZ82_011005 [Podila clonocystis]
MDYTSPASPPPPSVSSKFSRSGSSGSVASSIVAEPRPSVSYNRERSNTMQSEKSERSSRSVRSERTRVDLEPQRSDSDRSLVGRERERESRNQLAPSSRSERPRGQDAASAYKTPSPPLSPGELRSEPIMSPRPQYRPPTPPEASLPTLTRGRRPSVAPSRKRSTEQFDALMEDLIQEIKILPTAGTNSVRNSTRSMSSSTSRSRSRPNIPEFGRDRAFTASSTSTPPPTPGLPITSGTESLRGYRCSTREIRPTASERAHERDRSRTLDEKPSEGERDRDRDARERVRERVRDGREREQDQRESRVDRERARDRGRDRASTRSSIRSRSLSARSGIAHCEGCKHDIQAHEALDAVKMVHGDYHRECFKCGRCRRPIESHRQAREYEGRLLCERDYTRVKEKEAQKAATPSTTPSASPPSSHRPVCAGCEGSILSPDTAVYALGKSWHEHHLSCDHCHKPIQATVGHVEKNGRVYCPGDYGELFLPKCRGCGLMVEKEAVCTQDGKLEGKWHSACFGCHLCKKPFPDKSFYVFGNAPYCRRHYHKMNKSLCKGCDQPIEGSCAQTMEGWRFHPTCFSCVECREPLTDVYYNYENKAYCERDIMIIQRTRHNVRAERRRTFVGRV